MNILNNDYLSKKGLSRFEGIKALELGVHHANYRFATVQKGSYLSRPIYTLLDGQVGVERIYYEFEIAEDAKENSRFPKFTEYAKEFNERKGGTAPRGAIYTPINYLCGDEERHTVVIVGGLADGITVHEATRLPVLAVVGESRAKPLAEEFHALFPEIKIIVATDNDAKSFTGQKVAAQSGFHWVIPSASGSDWNDVFVADGLEEVARHFQPDSINEPIPNFDEWGIKPYLFNPNSTRRTRLAEFANLTDYQEIASAAYKLVFLMRSEIGIRFLDGSKLVEYLVRTNYKLGFKTVEELDRKARMIESSTRKQAINYVKVSRRVLARHNTKTFKASSDTDTLNHLLSLKGVTFIQAPHGDGKSSLLAKPYVHQAKVKGDEIVVMAHLRTLVSDLATKFGSEHYERLQEEYKSDHIKGVSIDEWMEANTVKVLAICLPSIVSALKDKVAKVETLVIDEVSQVVRFITTKLDKGVKNLEVYEQFAQIISSAKNVLALDADLNDITVKLFERIRPNERFNFINIPNKRNKEDPMKISLVYGKSSEDYVLSNALMEANRGKRIVIATDSKMNAKRIEAMFLSETDKRVFCIHSENSGNKEQRRFMRDADNVAGEYDVIIHSPTVRSGVSISKVKFDFAFGFFCGTTVLSQDAIQMLRRCRTVRDFVVAVNAGLNDNVIDPRFMEQQQEASDAKLRFDYGILDLEQNPDYDKLYYQIKNMETHCASNFAGYFYHQLNHFCFDITLIDSEKDQEGIDEFDLAGYVPSDAETILKAPMLTAGEFERLQDLTDPYTAEEAASLIKYRVCDFFAVDESELTKTMINEYRNRAISKAWILKWASEGEAANENHALTGSARRYSFLKGQEVNDALKALYELTGVEFGEGRAIDSIDSLMSTEIDQSAIDSLGEYLWTRRRQLVFFGFLKPSRVSRIDFKGRFIQSLPPKQMRTITKEFFERVGLKLSSRQKSVKQNGKVLKVSLFSFSDIAKLILGASTRLSLDKQKVDKSGNSLKVENKIIYLFDEKMNSSRGVEKGGLDVIFDHISALRIARHSEFMKNLEERKKANYWLDEIDWSEHERQWNISEL